MKNKKTRAIVLGLIASSLIISSPVFAATSQTTTAANTQVLATAIPLAALSTHGYNPNIDMNFFTNTNNLLAYYYGVLQGTANIYNDYIGYAGITSGVKVKALQCLLCDAGYTVTFDGYFGPQTYNAIIKFQQNHGLSADGIVGPNTWKSMMSVADVFIL